jgi:hypothetical protein
MKMPRKPHNALIFQLQKVYEPSTLQSTLFSLSERFFAVSLEFLGYKHIEIQCLK